MVGLDFGPYRDKGLLKLSTDRSEEIGLLLTEYINVIKTQIDKKKETGGGGGNGSMGPRGGMPQVSGLRDEAEAGSADVLPPPVMMRATMRPSAASPGSPSLGSSPSSPYRSPAMPMAAPASPRGHSVYSASAQTALVPFPSHPHAHAHDHTHTQRLTSIFGWLRTAAALHASGATSKGR